MIKISFPAKDKAAALEFGKALLAYSGETVLATTSNEVLLDLKETVMAPVDSVTVNTMAELGVASAVAKEITPLTSGVVQVDLNPVVEIGSLTENMDQTAATSSAGVDEKGVVFDDKYCGVATEPFYKSGAMKGQWKKKRGVTDDAYNKWYFDQLALQGVDTPASTGQADINVGAAFGQTTTTTTTTTTPETTQALECPADAGKFMVWVSELQGAGRMTEEQLNAAYIEAGITNPFSLFQDGGYAGVQAVFPVICRMAGL